VTNRDQDAMSLWSALCSFWRNHRRQRGVAGSLRLLASEFWQFLRDATSARRRQRYGDIDFDFDRRVDTTAANVSRRNHLIGVLSGTPYQPCDPELFRDMVGKLGIDYARFTFVDLGSGKGRALLLAAEYPFRRIVGVEWMPELHRIAQENIRKSLGGSERHVEIEPMCLDAREFVFPPGPLVAFLFNPLPESSLQQVTANLLESLRREPRPVYIVYHNPLLAHVLESTEEFSKLDGTMQAAVYRWRG
jgi:SAM-dependent methyltransferase